MQHRVAVDSTTEDYWETYFGSYGKQWVRKIPRRVATALVQRTAGVRPGEASAIAESAVVVPLMPRPVVTADRVCIEGAIDLVQNGTKTRRLFSAEFNHDGHLLALDHIPAPLDA
ncbi:hypothetical protein Rctr197k_033 [Virus Rctr197k]|nr:hypothetical protein Rctr197k_033 [Virus Rctr197k]